MVIARCSRHKAFSSLRKGRKDLKHNPIVTVTKMSESLSDLTICGNYCRAIIYCQKRTPGAISGRGFESEGAQI